MDDATISAEQDGVAETQAAEPRVEYPEGEYGIVDLFGHTKMVGRVSEVERFGAKMLCVEVIFGNELLPPVFHGGSAIYGLTPCTAEVAFRRQAKQDYYLPESIRATLPPKLPAALPHIENDDEDNEEEDDGEVQF